MSCLVRSSGLSSKMRHCLFPHRAVLYPFLPVFALHPSRRVPPFSLPRCSHSTHSHATSTVTPKRFPLRSVARRNVRQPDASLPRSFLLHLPPPPRFTSLSSFYIVTCKPPFQVPEIACLERSVGREKISRQSKRRGDRKSCRTLLIPHTLESSHQRCLHQLLLRRSKSARRTSSAQRSVFESK